MGAPYSYEEINAQVSQNSPNTIHCRNTALARYFSRYLFQQALSVYKWTLPESWDRDFFLRVLYGWGFVIIIKTPRFGVIPQPATLGGLNIYYQPRYAMVTNPALEGWLHRQLVIGEDCSIIKLQPDYGGILDLVGHYADQMALASEAISVNLLNSKLSYVLFADNKATGETLKKLYDRIASGEPAVVTDTSLMDSGAELWRGFQQNVGQNYIVTDILDNIRSIEEEFLSAIGINNANTGKRERLVTDEVNANNQEIRCRAELWLEELQDCCEKTKKMFPELGELSVDWRYKDAGNTVDMGSVELGQQNL